MKKIIGLFLAVMCFALVSPVQAQMKFGIKGGLNFSTFSFDKMPYFDYTYNSSTRSGFFFGPMGEYTISNTGLGIDAALLYSQKDLMVEQKIGQFRGLEVPINLKYTIGSRSKAGVFIAVGPDFYFDFSDDNALYGFSYDMEEIQIGINVGAGMKLMKHYQIGLNYTIPLTTGSGAVPSDGVTMSSSKYKIKNLQLSVAYIF